MSDADEKLAQLSEQLRKGSFPDSSARAKAGFGGSMGGMSLQENLEGFQKAVVTDFKATHNRINRLAINMFVGQLLGFLLSGLAFLFAILALKH